MLWVVIYQRKLRPSFVIICYLKSVGVGGKGKIFDSTLKSNLPRKYLPDYCEAVIFCSLNKGWSLGTQWLSPLAPKFTSAVRFLNEFPNNPPLINTAYICKVVLALEIRFFSEETTLGAAVDEHQMCWRQDSHHDLNPRVDQTAVKLSSTSRAQYMFPMLCKGPNAVGITRFANSHPSTP